MAIARRRTLHVLGAAVLATVTGYAGQSYSQQPDRAAKLGVLTDMSGGLSDMSGQGSVEAARLAIQDFGGQIFGKPVELVSADHQLKPEVGLAIARQWYENENVDVILDVPVSSIALAVNKLAGQDKKIAIFSSSATDRLTEDLCTPYGVHWTFNINSQTLITTKSLIERGQKDWFIFVQDAAFGHAQEAAIRKTVEASGGKVLGSVRHPVGTQDFAGYLLQAQASGAKMIGLASSGDDVINAVRQAQEFGLTDKGIKIASMINVITETHAIGLKAMQGMQVAQGFYWDSDDESRKFGKRFFEKIGRMPTEMQAGVYSATLQYLKAADAVKSLDPDKVLAKLRDGELNDAYLRNAKLLPNGRMLHDMLLLEIKAPGDSKYPWDYYKVISKLPKEDPAQVLAQSACPLVKK